ncbi:hypothetical protein [Clostridium saccharoperbutylacetonicum]|uniref:hypothetical protein n=1 Tax=Clostridium saccharoperbutylacetonicum TaxID=36745 RepID=UPI0039EA0103
MKDLIKGDSDWHDTINQNFEEVGASLSEKANNIDSNRSTADKSITGAINELNSSKARQSDLEQLGNVNLLINGDFKIWQRGSNTFTADGSKMYTADRWGFFRSGWATGAICSQFDGGNGYEYLIRHTNNIDTATAVQQIIDIPLTHSLKGKKLTLSFKARTGLNVTDTIVSAQIGAYKADSVGMGNGFKYYLNGENLVLKTVNSSNQKYIFTTDISAPCDADYLTVVILCYVHGTTSEHYIALSEVKLEIGTIATPFLSRTYEEELAMCQRYYQNYSNAIFNGQVLGQNNAMDSNINFRVRMRKTPTITVYNAIDNTPNLLSCWDTSKSTATITGFWGFSDQGFCQIVGTNFNVGSKYGFKFIADAEIY